MDGCQSKLQVKDAIMRWLYRWGNGRLQAMTTEAPSKEEAIKNLHRLADPKDFSEVPDDYELCSNCGYDHEYDGHGAECQVPSDNESED
jgi:hypothetical protein